MAASFSVSFILLNLTLLGVTGKNTILQCQNEEERICQEFSYSPSLNENLKLNGLPSCYCDELCEKYKDCCKQNVRDIQNASNVLDGQDIPNMSTCLRKEDDYVGFWLVNQCGEKGPKCIENVTWSHILLHLPVTDNNNISYFGAHCAKCNNVTHYKNWKIFVTHDPTSSSKLDFLQMLGEADLKKLTSILHNLHGIYLFPPSDISLRVCYGFHKENDTYGRLCPEYQNPVVHHYEDEAKYEVFKNLECCRNEGKCSILTRQACRKHKFSFLRAFQVMKEANVDIRSVGTRIYGVLLQFKELDRQCHQKQITCSDNCHISGKQCLSEDVRVFNYPLVRGRSLRFVTFESYNSLGIANIDVTVSALVNFLWNSKWRLRLDWDLSLKITEGSECDNSHKICTVMESYLQSTRSYKDLSYLEVTKLRTWTERLNVRIHIVNNTVSKPIEVLGSYSQIPEETLNCSCRKFEFIREKEYRDFSISIIPVKTAFEFHECVNFTFVLKPRHNVMNLNVFCNLKNDINESSILSTTYGVLGIVIGYFLLVSL